MEHTATASDLLKGAASGIWLGGKDADRSKERAIRCAAILGDTPIVLIDEVALDRLVEALQAQGLGPASVNRHVSSISKLLRWAERRRIIPRAPRVPFQREPRGRDRVFSTEEQGRILGWFKDNAAPAYGAYVSFLLETGMRCGEAHDLTPGDISRDKSGRFWALVRDSKNGTDRSVPLSKAAHRATQDAHGSGTIFSRVNRSTFSAMWILMRRDLGLDSACVPHALRHTRASILVNNNTPIAHIQQWLGHKSVMTTMRYAHTSRESLARALDAMESGEKVPRRSNKPNIE